MFVLMLSDLILNLKKMKLICVKSSAENIHGKKYSKSSSKYGKPDIVFIGKKVAIFCDSEFWHGYSWNENKDKIHSNKEFWTGKIERNIKRDEEVNKKLENDGWTVLRFWGKEILKNPEACFQEIVSVLEKKDEI